MGNPQLHCTQNSSISSDLEETCVVFASVANVLTDFISQFYTRSLLKKKKKKNSVPPSKVYLVVNYMSVYTVMEQKV